MIQRQLIWAFLALSLVFAGHPAFCVTRYIAKGKTTYPLTTAHNVYWLDAFGDPVRKVTPAQTGPKDRAHHELIAGNYGQTQPNGQMELLFVRHRPSIVKSRTLKELDLVQYLEAASKRLTESDVPHERSKRNAEEWLRTEEALTYTALVHEIARMKKEVASRRRIVKWQTRKGVHTEAGRRDLTRRSRLLINLEMLLQILKETDMKVLGQHLPEIIAVHYDLMAASKPLRSDRQDQ